jgi:hypothetical protein
MSAPQTLKFMPISTALIIAVVTLVLLAFAASLVRLIGRQRTARQSYSPAQIREQVQRLLRSNEGVTSIVR